MKNQACTSISLLPGIRGMGPGQSRAGWAALLAGTALLLVPPSLIAAPGGKGKPGGGGGGEDPPPPTEYDTVTTIPMPDGVKEYTARRLNNAGQTVGWTTIKGGRFDKIGPAFLWTGTETVILPNPPGHAYGSAYGISDGGLIVGGAGTDADRYSNTNVASAHWWAGQPGAFTTGNWNDVLPPGSSYRLLLADAITADGEFVAFTAAAPEWFNTYVVVGQVVRDEGGIPTRFANLWIIDTIDGAEGTVNESWVFWGNLSRGTGVNELGEVVPMVRACGWYGLQGDFGSAGPLGFVWELDASTGNARTIDLNPYPASEGYYSAGMAVNGSGEIVFRLGPPAQPDDPVGGGTLGGYYWSGDPKEAAVSLSQERPDTYGTVPRGIDPLGTVVGGSTYVDGAQFAFLWTASSGLLDLNTMVNTPNGLGSAVDINAAGQILIWGYSEEARGGRFMVVEPNGNW